MELGLRAPAAPLPPAAATPPSAGRSPASHIATSDAASAALRHEEVIDDLCATLFRRLGEGTSGVMRRDSLAEACRHDDAVRALLRLPPAPDGGGNPGGGGGGGDGGGARPQRPSRGDPRPHRGSDR